MKRTITRYECDGPDCKAFSELDDAAKQWIDSGVCGHSIFIYLDGKHEAVESEPNKHFCCPTCYGRYVAERVRERMQELANAGVEEIKP